MKFHEVFDYFNNDKSLFISKFNITRATFYNWKRENKISLKGQLKAQILTKGKFKASKEALERG